MSFKDKYRQKCISAKLNNLTYNNGQITRQDRLKLLKSENKVIWLTGLSGSGKSTIATSIEKILYKKGILSYVLDGDNIRHGLTADLGFSPKDRTENIRRIAEISKLFYDAGIFVIVGFISPYRSDRNFARELIGDDFIEVFVSCPIEICEQRDPKGNYKKAREGKIKQFTGVDAPYEKPSNPKIIIETDKFSIEECSNIILNKLNI